MAISSLLSLKKKKIYFIFYMYDHFACMYIVVLSVCTACRRKTRALGPLKLELQLAAYRCWELNLGIFKGSKCSNPLSHLSGFIPTPVVPSASFTESPHTNSKVSITQKVW